MSIVECPRCGLGPCEVVEELMNDPDNEGFPVDDGDAAFRDCPRPR